MMLKEKSKKYRKLKLLTLLPVTTLALYAFAKPEVQIIEQQPEPPKLEAVSYCFPLESTNITSGFGFRNGNTKIMHKGIDIKAAAGDTIFAFTSGEVIKEGRYDKGPGWFLILKHKEQLETRYTHNSAHLVKEGDVVKAGQAIAIVGSTGRSTGIHLHFEIRKDGEAIDPMRFFK